MPFAAKLMKINDNISEKAKAEKENIECSRSNVKGKIFSLNTEWQLQDARR